VSTLVLPVSLTGSRLHDRIRVFALFKRTFVCHLVKIRFISRNVCDLRVPKKHVTTLKLKLRILKPFFVINCDFTRLRSSNVELKT
jgi:hypothetical protein